MQDASRYRRKDLQALQGEFIPREQAEDIPPQEPRQPCPFKLRKQQVLDTIVDRIRAEEAAKLYEKEQKSRVAPVARFRDYA